APLQERMQEQRGPQTEAHEEQRKNVRSENRWCRLAVVDVHSEWPLLSRPRCRDPQGGLCKARAPPPGPSAAGARAIGRIIETEACQHEEAPMRTSTVVLGSVTGALAGLAWLGWRRWSEKVRDEEGHFPYMTALAAEALERGTLVERHAHAEPEIPGEDALLQVGDPDVDPLENAF